MAAFHAALAFMLGPETVERQPHSGGVGRVMDHVDEAADPHGIADPGVHVKGLAGQLHQAVHQGRAANQYRPGVEGVDEPGALDFFAQEGQEFPPPACG